MQHECQVLQIKREIENKTKQRIDKNQREYYLREEMKVIQEELGDKDGVGADAAKYRTQLDEKIWSIFCKEMPTPVSCIAATAKNPLTIKVG